MPLYMVFEVGLYFVYILRSVLAISFRHPALVTRAVRGSSGHSKIYTWYVFTPPTGLKPELHRLSGHDGGDAPRVDFIERCFERLAVSSCHAGLPT